MRIALFFVCIFISISSFAGIIKGLVNDQNGEVLPFASILVSGSNSGTYSNENGEFELALKPGVYEISFRYIGYKTLTKTYTVDENEIFEKIVLSPEVVQLKEVVVGKGEDPALTIMRKTIAMGEIHHNELSSYSYKAYTKGNLKVIDVPFLLEREMEKQYMKVGQLYVFESLIQFDFKQPNQLKQKTLAKKDNLPPTLKNGFNLNMGSFAFYDPTNSTSPVTLKGARNYRYEYLGFFEEGNQVINKIKVIPKTRANDLYNGVLNIVDKSWYVHSYDFTSKTTEGSQTVKVIFKNTDGIWIPNQYDYSIKLDILGIEANIKAIASIRDLSFTRNPRFSKAIPQVFDDKLFDAPPIDAPKAVGLKDLKSLKKAMIEAQKMENKSKPNSDFEQVSETTVDSLFDKRDSLFWEVERLVPLTNYEIEGFRKADSIVIANREKIEKSMSKDSSEIATRNKFKIQHLIVGHNYNFKPNNDSLFKQAKYEFKIGSIAQNLRFNPIEGLGVGLGDLVFTRNYDPNSFLEISSKPYYSFAQKRAFGNLKTTLSRPNFQINFKTGSEILQVNQQDPINGLFNSLNSLLQNENLARFFQKDYIIVGFSIFPKNKFEISSNVDFAHRNALENKLTKSPIRKGDNRVFEPNTVNTQSGKDIQFEGNWMNTWNSSIAFYPFLNKSKVNGKIRISDQNKASVRLNHSLGFGENGFGLLEFSANNRSEIRGVNWESRLNTGFFYNSPNYFIDYKHFNGNVVIANSHGDFRNLDYYTYSNDQSYLQFFNTLTPKRFLISQFNFVRKAGFKEYIFHNLLATSAITHSEVGYGLAFLEGAVNVEVLRSWNKLDHANFAFRIWSRVDSQ